MANRLAMTQATYSRKERGIIDITKEEWSKITEQFLVLLVTLLEKVDFFNERESVT